MAIQSLAATIFTSATILFLVQPMVGKILLPYLGGTPAVWNTCMLFFQALLLAGVAGFSRLKSSAARKAGFSSNW